MTRLDWDKARSRPARHRPPTERQMTFLAFLWEELGLPPGNVATSAEASLEIDRLETALSLEVSRRPKVRP